MTDPTAGSRRANIALDGINFSLADVRDGLGPYLATYLLTVQKWDEASIGMVMSIATASGIIAQTPAGGLIDATRAKRAVMATAAIAVAAASLLLPLCSGFISVAASQAAAHVSAAVFGPGLAAISLGIVGHAAFTRRIGRNESFNHAGNAFAAIAAGATAYLWGPDVVFYLLAIMSAASVLGILMIPAGAIDDALARGLNDRVGETEDTRAHSDTPSGLRVLFACRPLMILAIAVVFFHLANAAMLPLMAGVLTTRSGDLATVFVAACMVGPQVIVAVFSPWVGRKASAWGRRPLLLIAFATVPVRGLLFGLVTNPYLLIAVQLLDGIAGAVLAVTVTLIVVDMTRGTGHFNLGQGIVGTTMGIGASLSPTLAGYVSDRFGSATAFFGLAAIAAVGLAAVWALMTETRPAENE